jgi:hypothetical protein
MVERNEDVLSGWAKFLHPKALKSNLIVASLYIVSFEMLIQSVVKQLRNLYWRGFDKNGPITSPDYDRNVLALHKNKLTASLLWLKNNHAINDADVDLVDRMRRHRNALAHEMPKFLASSDAEIDVELLVAMHDLICKIDRWWIRGIELPNNPDFRGKEIPDAEIHSGNMIMLSMLLRVAVGDEEEATKPYETFVRMAEKEVASNAPSSAKAHRASDIRRNERTAHD